jgi:CAAX prenyl protease-like protein
MWQQIKDFLKSPAAAYVLPFVLYLLGTSFIARYGDEAYPVAYAVVVLLVGCAAILLLRGKRAFRIHASVFWGVFFGVVGIVLWILISELEIERRLTAGLPDFMQPQERVGYNPFEVMGNSWQVWAFVAVRLLGIAVLVPIAEELFWRGFLLRWLIDPEWEKVPLGEFTWQSCLIVTLMFTLAHPEWLAAASYCLLINGLLYWKRDLWLCIIAHATSNLLLVIYVLNTEAWWLW